MAQIPLVDGPGPVRMGAAAPMMGNAAVAPWQAVSEAGRAVQSVAGMAADYADRRQSSYEMGVRMDIKRRQKEAWAEFQKEMRTLPEDQWEDAWRERLNGVSDLGEAAGKLRSPALQGIEEDTQDALLESGIAVRALRDKRQIERDRARMNLWREEMLRSGYLEEANQIVDEAAAVGTIGAEDAARLKMQAEQEVAYYDASKLVQEDPNTALKSLRDQTENGRWRQFKALPPDTRNSLIGQAQRGVAEQRTALFNELVNGLLNGEPADPAQVNTYVQRGLLTTGQANNYLQAYRNAQPPTLDEGRFAEIMGKIDAYDSARDGHRTGFADLMGEVVASGLPKEQLGFLQGRLERRADPAKRQSAGEQAMEALGRMHGAHYFTGGEKPLSAEEILAGQQSYLKAVEQMQALAEANPTATPAELLQKWKGTKDAPNPIYSEATRRYAEKLLAPIQTPAKPLPLGKGTTANPVVRATYFRALQSKHPKLEPTMTLREAVKAIGEVTPAQMRELKAYYGDQ